MSRFLQALLPLRSRPAPADWCTVEVDGRAVQALPGQSVAAALIQAGIWEFHAHPISGEPRGPYCGMGVCFECEMTIDGAPDTRACLIAVRPGMVITTDQAGHGA